MTIDFQVDAPAAASPKTSGIDFQPLAAPSAAQQQMQSQPTNTPQQQASSFDMKGHVAAAVGGVANAAATGLEAGVDATLWAADKLGITHNPEATAMAKQRAHNDITHYLRSDAPGAPNDVFTQGAQDHPITHNIAKYGEGTGLLLAASPGQVVPKALGKIANMAGQAGVNALEGAGVAGQDPGNQDLGALMGAGGSVVGSAAAGIVNKAATSMYAAGTKLKEFLAPINKELSLDGSLTVSEQAVKSEANRTAAIIHQNDANYQQIKDIPGAINGNVIRSNILNFYKNNGGTIDRIGNQATLNLDKSLFSPEQARVLQSIQQDAGKLNNMESSVLLRQYLATNQPLFRGKGVPSSVKSGYDSLKQTLDAQIEQKASEAGLDGAYKDANKFNELYVQPLRDSGATNRLRAVAQENKRVEATQGAPSGQEPPINPAYTQAIKEILPTNPRPEKLKEVLSRMDENGDHIIQNYFIKQSLSDVLSNPQSFDKNAALIKINQTAEKYKDVLSTPTLETLNGVKILLKQAGAGKDAGAQQYLSHIIGGSLGATLGGYQGYEDGGAKGGAIGGIIGAGLGAMGVKGATQGMKGLLDTAKGQAILRYISKNPHAAKKLIQGASVGASTHFNQDDQSIIGAP